MRGQWGWVGWEIKQVLYVEDAVFVAKLRKPLQHIVNEFERDCDGMGLKINVGKSSVGG